MIRRAHSDWPRLLLPERGCFPPAVEVKGDERVLFATLRNSNNPGVALSRALRSMTVNGGAYREQDWRTLPPRACAAALIQFAREIVPTIVFLHLQRGGTFCTPEFVHALRAQCDPRVVILTWTGDRFHAPGDPDSRWVVDLGKVCDASLGVTTGDAEAYARLGVRHPGFLACGFDPDVYRPVEPAPDVPEIVMLANHHRNLVAYEPRKELCQWLSATFPGKFRVYGFNWEKTIGVASHPQLSIDKEAGIYAACKVAISMSMRNDLERYTSDRLLRMLGCGVLSCVEEFPDYAGLGLEHGINCLMWRDRDGLELLLRQVLGGEIPHADEIRRGARELSKLHTWDAHMGELMAIVDAVRAIR